MKTKLIGLLAIAILAGCTTAPPPMAAPAPLPPPPQTAGAEAVGKGSRPGFCTFKDASGTLFEKKC